MPGSGALAAIGGVEFARVRTALARLGDQPPQVLLLEGGNEESRWACALFWAMRLNCLSPGADGTPCLACAACQQLQEGANVDLLAYDGRISKKEDAENPGPARAIIMENMRELKRIQATAPHGKMRVVIFYGMQLEGAQSRTPNIFLKQMEEPNPSTRFVLLAPQREQLLPTLVSRSFCLSLPWPDRHSQDATTAAWENDLATFLATGRGFLDRVTARGVMDATLAAGLVLALQKALARVLAQDADSRPLDAALTRLDAPRLATCKQWLDEAQDMLTFAVTPARVVEALAMNMCVLLGQGGRT